MNQRIAITGATGLVGTELVRRLESQGSTLFFLRRPGSQKRGSVQTASGVPQPAEIEWNPAKGVVDESQLEGLDIIFHLAGRPIDSSRWTETEKRKLEDSRILSTQRLVSQISGLSRKPRVFVSASAVGYYGDCGDRWITESHPPATDDFLGSLAMRWEEASKPLEELGVRLVHARLGIVLSSQGGALAKVLPLFRMGAGGKLGSGQQYWSWIGLPDCCRGLMFLADHPEARGAFNLVSPHPVTNAEFTSHLGEALHRPTFLPAPKFALRAALGEMADALLLASCRARPERLEQLGFAFNQPELPAFLAAELK